MANNIAFQAMGMTYGIAATITSQTIQIVPDSPCNQVSLTNTEATTTGGNDIFVRFSQSANVTAVIPTPGAPQYAFCIAPGPTRVVTVPFQFSASQPLYAAVISNGSGNLYLTPGEGL